jgi:hypothetical protein
LALGLQIVSSSTADNCGDVGGWTTTCTTDGSQLDLSANATRPGSESARPGPDRPAQGGGGHAETTAPDTETEPETEPEDCGILGCRGNYEVVTIPDVTLADLVSFRPQGPTLSGEPAGFGIVGLPTNLVATASEQVLVGTLLGWDVRVRFTPTGATFDHGDGTTARTATGGATWASLGVPQFTPTDTSHVYRERGVYRVTATALFAASVDFGTGWRPVPGTLATPAGGYDIRVLEATTALVDRTCTENPRGPGC